VIFGGHPAILKFFKFDELKRDSIQSPQLDLFVLPADNFLE